MARTYLELVGVGLPIKASHVQTLRDYINVDAAQVSPAFRYNFSWTSVSSGEPILAKYLTEMRSAIQLLWDSKGRGPLPDWSSGQTPGGPSNNRTPTVIRASDISDLRRWLNDYEDNHSKSGVNSYSYAAGELFKPIITPVWAQNVAALSTTFPPPLRCTVTSSNPAGSVPPEADKTGYINAFKAYVAAGLPALFPQFGPEFFQRPEWEVQPNAPFVPGQFFNEAILMFASKVATMMVALASTANGGPGVTNAIIWNEPNDDANVEKLLAPDHFASLLMHTRASVTAVVPDASIIWGGVVFGPGSPGDQPDQNALDYIQDVYDALKSRDLAGVPGKPWPWSGINIHIHNVDWGSLGPPRTEASVQNIITAVRDLMDSNEDGDSALVVGEYGVSTNQEHDHPGATNNLFNWIARAERAPDGLFYFSHGSVKQDQEIWELIVASYPTPDTIDVGEILPAYTRFKALLETLP